MIDRYSRPQMRAIWTEENKFNAYLKVEILSAEAWSKLGVIPEADVRKIEANARFNVPRIREIEEQTRHDIVAFTRCVSESLGEEKKWVHYGLTSTDVVDTANGYLIKQADAILLQDLEDFLAVLKKRALEFKDTPCIGRTHGIHADITSFGLKWALWYEEMKRNIERFKYAAQGVEAGKMSGAVGNFANIPPFIQDYVCEQLGIASADISTQVLQRDRHAFYIATLAVIASTLEQMAFEVRNLQRTEVREAEEAFRKGQKGSSAMPHKRNPISSENICGCARVMRGYAAASCENVALWHERDISHSSTERIILPDATELLDYMLTRFAGGRTYNGWGGSAMPWTDVVESVSTAVADIGKLLGVNDNVHADAERIGLDITKAIGQLTGQPLGGLYKNVTGTYHAIKDDDLTTGQRLLLPVTSKYAVGAWGSQRRQQQRKEK